MYNGYIKQILFYILHYLYNVYYCHFLWRDIYMQHITKKEDAVMFDTYYFYEEICIIHDIFTYHTKKKREKKEATKQ